MDNKSPPCTNERENMRVVECPSNGPILDMFIKWDLWNTGEKKKFVNEK